MLICTEKNELDWGKKVFGNRTNANNPTRMEELMLINPGFLSERYVSCLVNRSELFSGKAGIKTGSPAFPNNSVLNMQYE